jgi:hypothetical protein
MGFSRDVFMLFTEWGNWTAVSVFAVMNNSVPGRSCFPRLARIDPGSRANHSGRNHRLRGSIQRPPFG